MSKLQACKFENANLERAHRTKAMDKKTLTHAEAAMKHCKPGISATVKKYNDQQNELVGIRTAGHEGVRADAFIPPEIKLDDIYWMDVDSSIWFEFPLNDDLVVFGGQIPRWLGDNLVQKGICFAQEALNSREEIICCRKERTIAQQWAYEENAAITYTLERSIGAIRLPEALQTV